MPLIVLRGVDELNVSQSVQRTDYSAARNSCSGGDFVVRDFGSRLSFG